MGKSQEVTQPSIKNVYKKINMQVSNNFFTPAKILKSVFFILNLQTLLLAQSLLQFILTLQF